MASQGYEQLIEDCEENQSKLTDWECTFLDLLKGYIHRDDYLTDKQIVALEKIWERVTRVG